MPRAKKANSSIRADGRRARRVEHNRPNGPWRRALSQTMVDAGAIGQDLGSAGATIARDTVKLAVDVVTVLRLAASSVISNTIAAGEAVYPNTPREIHAAEAARKPLARSPGSYARRQRQPRAASA